MTKEEDLKKICNQFGGRYRERGKFATCVIPKSLSADGIDLDFSKNKLQITVSGTPYFIKSEKPLSLDITGTGKVSTAVMDEKESAIFGKIDFKTISVEDMGLYNRIAIENERNSKYSLRRLEGD